MKLYLNRFTKKMCCKHRKTPVKNTGIHIFFSDICIV